MSDINYSSTSAPQLFNPFSAVSKKSVGRKHLSASLSGLRGRRENLAESVDSSAQSTFNESKHMSKKSIVFHALLGFFECIPVVGNILGMIEYGLTDGFSEKLDNKEETENKDNLREDPFKETVSALPASDDGTEGVRALEREKDNAALPIDLEGAKRKEMLTLFGSKKVLDIRMGSTSTQAFENLLSDKELNEEIEVHLNQVQNNETAKRNHEKMLGFLENSESFQTLLSEVEDNLQNSGVAVLSRRTFPFLPHSLTVQVNQNGTFTFNKKIHKSKHPLFNEHMISDKRGKSPVIGFPGTFHATKPLGKKEGAVLKRTTHLRLYDGEGPNPVRSKQVEINDSFKTFFSELIG
ncbi:hypothetical protein SCG7109_AA_00430 [Chlamydiales bacterium SCGC AG-110-M15]|nr:hypothetical protein SCG7109_AA_00430 [Chlamydiales bacterium SCGC AG-110-M15]